MPWWARNCCVFMRTEWGGGRKRERRDMPAGGEGSWKTCQTLACPGDEGHRPWGEAGTDNPGGFGLFRLSFVDPRLFLGHASR